MIELETNVCNPSIEAIEPLDIDEVMVNLFIDLALNDTADDDIAPIDMISIPDLVDEDDIGYLGDCEEAMKFKQNSGFLESNEWIDEVLKFMETVDLFE